MRVTSGTNNGVFLQRARSRFAAAAAAAFVVVDVISVVNKHPVSSTTISTLKQGLNQDDDAEDLLLLEAQGAAPFCTPSLGSDSVPFSVLPLVQFQSEQVRLKKSPPDFNGTHAFY